MKTKIGIFGGMFDPIHNGHLRSAQEVMDKLKLDRISIMPCGDSSYKGSPNVAKFHRICMLKLATGENPSIEINYHEIDNLEVSYTVGTLNFIHSCRKKGEIELFLIIGADQAKVFNTWKDYKEIPKLCTVVATNRDGCISPELALIQMGIPYKYVEISNLGISSTKIRNLVKAGISIKYLVPDAVESYIHEHKLYLK